MFTTSSENIKVTMSGYKNKINWLLVHISINILQFISQILLFVNNIF